MAGARPRPAAPDSPTKRTAAENCPCPADAGRLSFGPMLSWSKLLGLGAVDAALFFLSGWTAQSSEHSGTVSDMLWGDFLLGVLLLMALTVATAVRVLLSLRR